MSARIFRLKFINFLPKIFTDFHIFAFNLGQCENYFHINNYVQVDEWHSANASLRAKTLRSHE